MASRVVRDGHGHENSRRPRSVASTNDALFHRSLCPTTVVRRAPNVRWSSPQTELFRKRSWEQPVDCFGLRLGTTLKPSPLP
jgi:hypothetical protein